jgi:shikimate dehydrogenase
MTKRFGLLGGKLSHSYSPLIHAELVDYDYHLYEKKPEELDEFFREGGFDGLNVTIPYKRDVIKYCSEMSETARRMGSVNTLVRRRDGTFYGHNTDYYGFTYLLNHTDADISKGKTIVLGNGGSSQTVQAVLRDQGAKTVAVISRGGENNYENLDKHKDALYLVNTTPVGMYPGNGAAPVNLGIFPQCEAVMDLIYNPTRTELMLIAEARGIPAYGGLRMLTAQAKRSSELFAEAIFQDGWANNPASEHGIHTEQCALEDTIERITAKILSMSQNIILIGMPGCGKSSIGAELARRMGRSFADTDIEIERRMGKHPARIIAEEGEDAFRALEHEVLQGLCKERGMVVATGGGIVTRPENYRCIRQNGRVFFLDRDIAKLPLEDRPLSIRDGVEQLMRVRLPLYKQWSDNTVSVNGIDETAEEIINLYVWAPLAAPIM